VGALLELVICYLYIITRAMLLHGRVIVVIITACGSDSTLVLSIIAKFVFCVSTITHEPLHMA